MHSPESSIREMACELFGYYPDYLLCRALAENVQAGRLSLASAIQQLASRARAMERNRLEIQQKLDRQSILIGGQAVPIRKLSLRRIMRLGDPELESVVRFYCKHPFAHGRTFRSRWIPSWIRSFFLRAILGHAKNRNLPLDYRVCFDMLQVL